MDILSGLMPLFTAGIFFIGFLALLLTGFNALLNAKIDPLKENQARLEKKVDQLIAAKNA